jgi:hypothetical protein
MIFVVAPHLNDVSVFPIMLILFLIHDCLLLSLCDVPLPENENLTIHHS